MEENKKQRQLKCSVCKDNFDREYITKKNGKNYCQDCLKAKEEESLKNKDDWSLLYDYICELYNISQLNGFFFKQLKDFRGENYNYTNIGMYYTLKYYYEILENEIVEGTGLGIIPYYYERSKQHYSKVFNIQDISDEFKNNEQIIKIKTTISNRKLDDKKPLPLISWEGSNEDT